METADTPKSLERLARVRENQRKSRARKQEHVRGLEQQLSAHKDQTRKNDIEHRLAMQKIEAENRNLKALLVSVGISPELIEQYLQSASHGTEMDQKVAIPVIKRQPVTASKPPSSSKDANELGEDWVASQSARVTAATSPTAMSASKSGEHSEPDMCKCSAENQDPTKWPREEDVLNSTMCAIAEELVTQHNIRGADPEEIRRRLWSGFRTGSSGNGCRVQNQVLFQVLNELSDDI